MLRFQRYCGLEGQEAQGEMGRNCIKLVSFGNQLNSPPHSPGLVISSSSGRPQDEHLEIPPRLSSGLHSIIKSTQIWTLSPSAGNFQLMQLSCGLGSALGSGALGGGEGAAAPCPALPAPAEPLATRPRALPNLSLNEQPQIGCVKGGKKAQFKAWLRFKAVEDVTAAQQLAAWMKGNQDKPAPGAFASICSLSGYRRDREP